MTSLKYLLGGFGLAAILVVTGCGDDGGSPFDEGGGEPTQDDGGSSGSGSGDGGTGGDGVIDESTLPDGFPRDLIPEGYDTGSTLDLTGQFTASFLSSADAADSIAFYTDRLGEPGLVVEGDPGEFNATWELDTGWIVSVLGGPGESIIGVSRFDDE